MHLFCPLQYSNVLICKILIFGIIFDYDFFQFLINGLSVLRKGLKIGPSDCIIQMSEASEFRGLHPLDPRQGRCPSTPPGALRQAPGPHTDLRPARYAQTFQHPHFKKRSAGPALGLLFILMHGSIKVTFRPTEK